MEDLTPLYNKEFYLAYLCGENVVLPIPDGNTEHYLAYLCGMDVEIPDVPDGNNAHYLAYKCGQDVELPDPLYRIEFYLAKWCGMDVEVPEPMYRIEYWLAQLANSGMLKTVTGNPITVSDAIAKPAESLSIEILPSQDLHGYANPWPAGGGKNLTSYDTDYVAPTGTTSTVNLFAMNVEGGVTYTFSCKQSASIASSTRNTIAVKPGGGDTTYENSGTNFNPTNLRHTLTFTPSENGTYVFMYWGHTISASVTLSEWQVEKSSSFTGYSPYSNICPISGHDSVKVWVKPTYDPTANPTATIQLGQTVYGGTLDVTTGVLTVDRAMVTFDGTQPVGLANWRTNESSAAWLYVQNVTPGIKTIDSGSVVPNIISDRLKTAKYGSSDGIYDGTFDCISVVTGGASWGIAMRVTDTSLTTASAINAWLAENPVTVVYELATPQTVQLTPTQVQMLLGNNTIWNDVDGDMTLEYLADGPADDADALQILLNNRYVNNGEPDEATDREALDILLGGR